MSLLDIPFFAWVPAWGMGGPAGEWQFQLHWQRTTWRAQLSSLGWLLR